MPLYPRQERLLVKLNQAMYVADVLYATYSVLIMNLE